MSRARDELRQHLRQAANRTRDTADEMAAMMGGCDDPLHPFLTTGVEFRDWVDFVDRVARPLVEAEEDTEVEQAAMALYRKASPFSICVSMVMMANRLSVLEALVVEALDEDCGLAVWDNEQYRGLAVALSQATTRSPEPETPDPDRSPPG